MLFGCVCCCLCVCIDFGSLFLGLMWLVWGLLFVCVWCWWLWFVDCFALLWFI